MFNREKPSPSDIISKHGIMWYETTNKIEIDLNQINIPFRKPPIVWTPDIPDTNSMDAVFDMGNNNILIAGADESEAATMIDSIMVGDIVVYQAPNGGLVIHRVTKVGHDKEGRYFKFKGDNNFWGDPYKVRDKNILWLSIGTIY